MPLPVVPLARSHRADEVEPMGRQALSDVYDPVAAGELLPDGFRQLLPRDAIPPVYEPRFTSAEDARYPDDALVLGVEIDGDAHAYPISVLNHREMVNDKVGGTPILSTWLPLGSAAMVHRREIEGEEVVLGNQGALFKDAMTWWDHDTGSVWSQTRGEAILGPRSGYRLESLRFTVTVWASWRRDHPGTLALDADSARVHTAG